MKTRVLGIVFLAGLLALTLSQVVIAQEPALVSHDGLHLVQDTEFALAYVRPGADFGVYERVQLLEAYVAFRKDWERDQRRDSMHSIGPQDVERMKLDMSELVRETFVEGLETAGYKVTESAEADVLLLRPAIVDLDVTAPDLKRGRTYTYAASAGSATLVLEIYDSVSGQILARVIDRKAASNRGGVMRWTNTKTNRAAAKEILSEWAGLLLNGLDEIRGDDSEGGASDD